MANRRFTCEFDGMDRVIRRLDAIGGNIKEITDQALKETHNKITSDLHRDMNPHHRTGRTESAISEQTNVSWVGSIASIEIGFDLRHGGMPSIYLMYGTPRMKKDQKLYNDIYGRQTINAVRELQANVFYSALRRLGG